MPHQDFRQKHKGERDEPDGGGIQPRAREDPESERKDSHRGHDQFAPRDRAQGRKLPARPFGHIRAGLQRWRVDHICESRQRQEEHESDGEETYGPLAPSNACACGIPDQRYGEEVCRVRGQKHGARDARRGEGSPHKIGADPAATFAGGRVVQAGNALDNREDHAAASSGVGGRERRQHEVDDRDSIAQPQGGPSEPPHQAQCDPAPEPGPLVAETEHEGDEDEPYRRVGETGQRPSERFVRIRRDESERRRDSNPEDAYHGARQRLGDESSDHSHEEREVSPGTRGQSGRSGHDPNRHAQNQWNHTASQGAHPEWAEWT